MLTQAYDFMPSLTEGMHNRIGYRQVYLLSVGWYVFTVTKPACQQFSGVR